MSSLTARLWRGANAAAVWVYRRTGGRLGGKAKGAPVLLLTAPGRKSGRAHTVPVAYVLRDGWYYLAASAGGARPYKVHVVGLATGKDVVVATGKWFTDQRDVVLGSAGLVYLRDRQTLVYIPLSRVLAAVS